MSSSFFPLQNKSSFHRLVQGEDAVHQKPAELPSLQFTQLAQFLAQAVPFSFLSAAPDPPVHDVPPKQPFFQPVQLTLLQLLFVQRKWYLTDCW